MFCVHLMMAGGMTKFSARKLDFLPGQGGAGILAVRYASLYCIVTGREVVPVAR